MLQKYLVFLKLPELRSEPQTVTEGVQQVELLISIEEYWELQEIIKRLKYETYIGRSGHDYWKRFNKIVSKRIIMETDRLWFIKSYGS